VTAADGMRALSGAAEPVECFGAVASRLHAAMEALVVDRG